MSGRVVMKVMDQDLVGDDIVGSLLFNLKDCIDKDKLNGKFFWKNIYGAPLDKSGANTDLMNSSPECASTWKGRILMKVTAEKTEKPVCIKKSLMPKEEVKSKDPKDKGGAKGAKDKGGKGGKDKAKDKEKKKEQEEEEQQNKLDMLEAEKYLRMQEFEVIAEVGQGLALPDPSKYKVMIKIGELELKTDDPKI